MNRIDEIMALYSSKLPIESISLIRQKLEKLDYNTAALYLSHLKDPMISLILSLTLGGLGVDRFYIGDAGIGVGKLLTCGGLYVWWIIDLFLIMDATRRKNMEIILAIP